MELNDIAIDVAKVEEGDWVDNIPDMGTLRLKVRGIDNNDFTKLMRKLMQAVPRKKKLGGNIDPEELDTISAKCLHQTVLIDWDGVIINGAETPYSKDLAKELLTNPKWKRFREAVVYAATQVGQQDQAAKEEDLGN